MRTHNIGYFIKILNSKGYLIRNLFQIELNHWRCNVVSESTKEILKQRINKVSEKEFCIKVYHDFSDGTTAYEALSKVIQKVVKRK
jgi:hypothetical protein